MGQVDSEEVTRKGGAPLRCHADQHLIVKGLILQEADIDAFRSKADLAA